MTNFKQEMFEKNKYPRCKFKWFAYLQIIHLLVATITPILVTIKQMVHKILHEMRTSSLTLTCDPKSIRDTLLIKTNKFSKFGNHQVRDHQIIRP